MRSPLFTATALTPNLPPVESEMRSSSARSWRFASSCACAASAIEQVANAAIMRRIDSPLAELEDAAGDGGGVLSLREVPHAVEQHTLIASREKLLLALGAGGQVHLVHLSV